MIIESELSPKMGVVLTGERQDLATIDRPTLTNHLRQRGAVVMRGFGLTVGEYEDLSRELSRDFLVHHDLDRLFVSNDGTTQTVVPGTGWLPAHVERGYAAPIPGMLFFYCDRPPLEAGETTLYDGYDIFQALDADAQHFFASSKLLYRLRISPELWQRTLQTDDHSEALYIVDQEIGKSVNRERGERAACRVDGDFLVLDFIAPATRRSSRRDGEAFSNSSLTFLRTLGLDQNEGIMSKGTMDLMTEQQTPVPAKYLRAALDASESVVIKVKWNKGDMVLLDNYTVLHGRAAFNDQSRNVFVRIGFGSV